MQIKQSKAYGLSPVCTDKTVDHLYTQIKQSKEYGLSPVCTDKKAKGIRFITCMHGQNNQMHKVYYLNADRTLS